MQERRKTRFPHPPDPSGRYEDALCRSGRCDNCPRRPERQYYVFVLCLWVALFLLFVLGWVFGWLR